MLNTCYMCNNKATSVEHVPPRCLFPEKKDLPPEIDLRKELITVPSCDEHNTQTSKDDEYLLYVLLMNIANNKYAENHFTTKVIRAIQRNPSVMALISKYSMPVVAKDNHTGEVHNTTAFKIDVKRINLAMDKIGRALYFKHFKIKWCGSISVYPNFLLSLEDANSIEINENNKNLDEAVDELFESLEHLGSNRQIFSYQIVSTDYEVPHIMRLHFYEGARVTLMFKRGI
jgi:hypothetical protein